MKASLLRVLSSGSFGASDAAEAAENDKNKLKVRVFSDSWKDQLKMDKKKPIELIGVIDQGTSSTRFMAFTCDGKVAASAQMEHSQIFPSSDNENNDKDTYDDNDRQKEEQQKSKVGWHEHDPMELWENVCKTMKAVARALEQEKVEFTFVAIGITNQRETTVAWNRITGIPYYNAIVWDDTRTAGIANHVAKGNANRIRNKTGLPLASYFAGTKVKWLLDNVSQLREDLLEDLNNNQKNDNDGDDENKQSGPVVCFGTIDAWLLYKLTNNDIFCTDVSNASRWLFLDLNNPNCWDPELVNLICHPHKVPLSSLPTICPSSHVFGTIHAECGLADVDDDDDDTTTVGNHFSNVPLAAVLGDQQAALFGQTAFEPGEAKNTYGTGLFLMMNTGTKAITSTHGLLTTIAYQIGSNGPVHYALEGSVSHSGSTIQWLRDQLHLIDSASASETAAAETTSNAGLYFVPAFGGLFAPHWRSDARACIVGMTASHHRGHVCRAALEAAAYQTREVLQAIQHDSQVQLTSLRVDGGGTANELLMQFQADMIGVPVVRPSIMETTSMGAAFCAGLAVGVWNDVSEIKQYWSVAKTYQPSMSEAEVLKNWNGWKMAVTRSLSWAVDEDKGDDDDDDDDDDDVEGFQDALERCDSVMGDGGGRVLQRHASRGRTWQTLSVVVVAGAALAIGFQMGRRSRR